MKKIIIIIVAALIVVGGTLGIIFGVRSCNNKKAENVNNTVEHVQMLKQEYKKGEKIIFNFYVYSDVEFVSISFKLNNGSEQSVSGATTGESADHENYDGKGGKFYIETGAQVVDSADLELGWYTVIFECKAKDGATYKVPATPYMFEVVAPTTAA